MSTRALEIHEAENEKDFGALRAEIQEFHGLKWYARGIIAALIIAATVLWRLGPWMIEQALNQAIEKSPKIESIEHRLSKIEEHVSF